VAYWSESILEFAKIKEQLKNLAITSAGKEQAEKLNPAVEKNSVQELWTMTNEALTLDRLQQPLPLLPLPDFTEHFKRVTRNATLNGIELIEILALLKCSRQIKTSLSKHNLPAFLELAQQLTTYNRIEELLINSLEPSGILKDNASPALATIRHQLTTKKDLALKTIQLLFKNRANMLQEALVTKRYERYVIPIKREFRSRIGGIVHDESASGTTLFVEPPELIPINNDLLSLTCAENHESEHILTKLTTSLAPDIESFRLNLNIIGQLDLAQSKALYAKQIKGSCPKISAGVKLKQARHPFIPSDQVIANDLYLSPEQRIVVITGPNTGGKTVTLKLLGLLAVMFQTGIPLPVAEDSSMTVFNSIYADIGDEQSIEKNLSTFSSHLLRIIKFLPALTEDSLVLLDELGAGTDPEEGAALAIAIIDYLIQKKCWACITSHYGEVKNYAHLTASVINAAVQFNLKNLSPTYLLKYGHPGASNALAIAAKLGLPTTIIKKAEDQLGLKNKHLQEILTAMEKEYQQVQRNQETTTILKEELLTEKSLQQARLQKQEEELHNKINSMLAEAEQQIEETLENIRKDNLKEHLLLKEKQKLQHLRPQTNTTLPKLTRSPRIGDLVRVEGFQGTGKVLTAGSILTIQFGQIKTKVPQAKITHLHLERTNTPKSRRRHTSSLQLSSEHIRAELDLRGNNSDEALSRIDRYLDQARLTGYREVTLIHGKGTGALRKNVQNFVARHKAVKSYRLGGYNEGGTGVTVVVLK
jgi:DNA mismatch repair protein MutS2